MGTHHFPSHASSVSLGALGQHPQPGLLERHFFALTLGDSSKEAQRGCKEGLSFQTGAGHPAPTSLWCTDAKYSSCFPIAALFPLAVPFVSLLVICQTLWPDFCTWCACERIPSFSCPAQIVLLAPYCLIFHILFFSIFFSWTQPQLSAALLYL